MICLPSTIIAVTYQGPKCLLSSFIASVCEHYRHFITEKLYFDQKESTSYVDTPIPVNLWFTEKSTKVTVRLRVAAREISSILLTEIGNCVPVNNILKTLHPTFNMY